VLKALKDKSAIRRGMAGAALMAGPYTDHMKEIRALLKDKDPYVKKRVALALAQARDKEAVPTLIALVSDLPGEHGSEVEDYLTKLARDNMPKDLPEGDSNRKKRSETWSKWWTANQKTVAMVGRDAPEARERYLGYQLQIRSSNNQIVELDKTGKQRWAISGVLNPWDAQVLRGGKRVLVTEYSGMRVTEYDIATGKAVKTINVGNYPMSAERLRNGNTFVVCRNQLIEYNKAGKEVYKIARNNFNEQIYSARKLPNGEIVAITSSRNVERLDKNGKVLKSFQLPALYYNQNEILNNGNVLIPLGYQNKVDEYDKKGKHVRTITAMQAVHATRLPNGNTLVSVSSWPYKILEFDKKGKQVKETTTNVYLFRVRGR